MTRGFFGIGVLNLQNDTNYGTLFRSAYAFGADFMFLIGERFKKQPSDCLRSERHIPLFQYTDFPDFRRHLPFDCHLVSVEIDDDACNIGGFSHPQRAAYLLGPENGSLPTEALRESYATIRIPTKHCLNVAVAGSIVLYDRVTKDPITNEAEPA